jgi:hypothetical protein
MRALRHEIVRPHLAGIVGSWRDAQSIIELQSRAFGMLLRHLEFLELPAAFQPLAVHRPVGIAQKRRQLAITAATILSGQGDDVCRESGFVIRPARRLALCRSMLLEHTAGLPLGQRHPGPDMLANAKKETGPLRREQITASAAICAPILAASRVSTMARFVTILASPSVTSRPQSATPPPTSLNGATGTA